MNTRRKLRRTSTPLGSLLAPDAGIEATPTTRGDLTTERLASACEQLLESLVAGTASSTGDRFFEALVANVAPTLGVSYAFVAEFLDGNTRVRTLARWSGGRLLDNIEYEVAGTACEEVLSGTVRLYEDGVQSLFPQDPSLHKLEAQSYLAIPLLDPEERVLGHLGVIDNKPMTQLAYSKVLEVFAARAGSELRRLQVEAALRRANRRMRGDLEAAARAQESLLPDRDMEFQGLSVSWAFQPCEELAGDLLNVFAIDETRVGFYVLDVSGHGVRAALLAVTLNRILSPEPNLTSVLKQHVGGSRYRLLSPAEIADQLNRQFGLDPDDPQYFTLLFGVLNVATGRLRYLSAGHPGPVLVPPGKRALSLDVAGFPIGLIESAAWSEQVLELEPGTRLYLYSDGVIETSNREGQHFGKERLLSSLEEGRRLPLDHSLAMVQDRQKQWRGSHRVEDDVSLLGLEIAASG